MTSRTSAFTRASNTPASLFLAFLLALTISCQRTTTPVYDILILGGEVYDGSGDAPIKADVAISGDKIARIGQVDRSQARRIVDASGQAVTPGFINMLSWSTDSLIADGNSQGELRQGVTTEIMGEGDSMGPLTPAMKERMLKEQGRHQVPHRMDHTRRVPDLSGKERCVAECGFVSRCNHASGICHRPGRQASNTRAA